MCPGKFVREHPVLASAVSIGMAPLQGAEFVGQALGSWGHSDTGELGSYEPMNPYNMNITNTVNTLRGTVAEEIEKNTDWELFGQNVASFLYQTGMSIGDSALQVGTLGRAATLFMGGSAAASQAQSVMARGGSNRQALWGGLAAGAAEMLFEYVSIDNLLKPKTVTGWKSFLKEAAKQAGVEGSEELFTEVANILRNATSRSLLILDEIGRGTSPFDGLSIAWAVIEHISSSKLLGAKTLFATHYHELTELEGKITNVNNYCIAVKEKGDDIIFLRKIVKGGADKSYGIQVARLAGVPKTVTDRAKKNVEELDHADITTRIKDIAVQGQAPKIKTKKYDEVDLAQMSLFDTVKDDDVLEELKCLDVSNLTPIDALNTLYQLQNKLKNRW